MALNLRKMEKQWIICLDAKPAGDERSQEIVAMCAQNLHSNTPMLPKTFNAWTLIVIISCQFDD